MRLTKDDSEVNLANGEAEPEFAEWKWASPEEVIEQVCHELLFFQKNHFEHHFCLILTWISDLTDLQAVDYKRPTYEEVMRTFQPYFNQNSISTKCKSSKW